jgi:hypothetical protein
MQTSVGYGIVAQVPQLFSLFISSSSNSSVVISSLDLPAQLVVWFTIASAIPWKKSARVPYFLVLSGLANL